MFTLVVVCNLFLTYFVIRGFKDGTLIGSAFEWSTKDDRNVIYQYDPDGIYTYKRQNPRFANA